MEQEAQPAIEPKMAVEAPENPKNPLNDNVNGNENEKENGNANDYVYDTVDEKENTNVNDKEKENVEVKGKDNAKDTVDEKKTFFDSLILDDFEDEEDYHPYGEGSASAYMERLRLQDEERGVRRFMEELEDT